MRVLRPGDPRRDLKPRSIFLAGPTPRLDYVESWRPAAIVELGSLGFEGDVLAPEPFVGDFHRQVNWEFEALENCGCICFWIPRDLEFLPAFTTNVEFGRYVASGRTVYGRPEEAPMTGYLDWLYEKFCGREPESNLCELMRLAVDKCQA